MSSIGTRRIQTLINNNNNELVTQAALQVKKVKFYPADPTSSLVTADTTFTAAQAGKIVLIDNSSSGNITMTLPTGVTGMHFTFMLVSNSNAAAELLIDSGTSNGIRGVSTGIGNATFVNINAQSVGFADAEKRGAVIELFYIGNRWFLKHAISTVALITSFS